MRSRIQIGVYCLILLSFFFSSCSDFKAIFQGKKGQTVASRPKDKIRKSKTRYLKVPKHLSASMLWPLMAFVSSPYGPRNGRFHEGIDIDGSQGDPIRAAESGKVVFSGSLGGYGKLVVIQHKSGLFTTYAHNKKNLVKKGKWVYKGEHIALVGSTGRTTGSHLHFEVRDKNGSYNPLDLLPSRRYSPRR